MANKVGAAYFKLSGTSMAALVVSGAVALMRRRPLPTVYNPATTRVDLVFGTTVLWGTNVVWGVNVVWGTNIVWGSEWPAGESIAIAVNGEN